MKKGYSIKLAFAMVLLMLSCLTQLKAQALGPVHKSNDQNMPITLGEKPLFIRDNVTGYAIYQLPELPYKVEELGPNISAKTMLFHYGKHTLAYMENLNKLLPESSFRDKPIEEIIRKGDGAIFNNAAQFWNHAFFFYGVRPLDSIRANAPMGDLSTALIARYGSIDNFKKEFFSAATSLFGSGWVWLCLDKKGVLQIKAMPNAGNPIREGGIPLLCVDVWEHAYYLDYQNKRAEYIKNWYSLVYWESADWLYRKVKKVK